MPRRVLTDEELWVLASAPTGASPADLARQLGRPYRLVMSALRRIRRSGWICVLYWATCLECGAPVCSGEPVGRLHVACERVRHAGREAGYRARKDRTTVRAYDREWRQRPEARLRRQAKRSVQACAEYERSTPEQRDAASDRWTASKHCAYSASIDGATAHGQIWSDAEDSYLLKHMGDRLRDVARVLGRITYAVSYRRGVLRKRAGALEPVDS